MVCENLQLAKNGAGMLIPFTSSNYSNCFLLGFIDES